MPRRLGQHFLRPAPVEHLLELIAPRPGESFLEIGPGAGALTLPLAARAGRVVAVELDPALATRLRERVPPNVTVVEGDALRVDLPALLRDDPTAFRGPGASSRWRVVGNLPYYVSSPLLRRFLGLRGLASDLHVMLQEEVADRVTARPGSRAYGILSVAYALWLDVDVPWRLGPGAFSPPPRVRSAVLRARFRDEPRADVPDPEAFERLVRAAFARRRRTLENNLQVSYANLKKNLRLLNIEGSRRAETLDVWEFAALARVLEPL